MAKAFTTPTSRPDAIDPADTSVAANLRPPEAPPPVEPPTGSPSGAEPGTHVGPLRLPPHTSYRAEQVLDEVRAMFTERGRVLTGTNYIDDVARERIDRFCTRDPVYRDIVGAPPLTMLQFASLDPIALPPDANLRLDAAVRRVLSRFEEMVRRTEVALNDDETQGVYRILAIHTHVEHVGGVPYDRLLNRVLLDHRVRDRMGIDVTTSSEAESLVLEYLGNSMTSASAQAAFHRLVYTGLRDRYPELTDAIEEFIPRLTRVEQIVDLARDYARSEGFSTPQKYDLHAALQELRREGITYDDLIPPKREAKLNTDVARAKEEEARQTQVESIVGTLGKRHAIFAKETSSEVFEDAKNVILRLSASDVSPVDVARVLDRYPSAATIDHLQKLAFVREQGLKLDPAWLTPTVETVRVIDDARHGRLARSHAPDRDAYLEELAKRIRFDISMRVKHPDLADPINKYVDEFRPDKRLDSSNFRLRVLTAVFESRAAQTENLEFLENLYQLRTASVRGTERLFDNLEECIRKGQFGPRVLGFHTEAITAVTLLNRGYQVHEIAGDVDIRATYQGDKYIFEVKRTFGSFLSENYLPAENVLSRSAFARQMQAYGLTRRAEVEGAIAVDSIWDTSRMSQADQIAVRERLRAISAATGGRHPEIIDGKTGRVIFERNSCH